MASVEHATAVPHQLPRCLCVTKLGGGGWNAPGASHPYARRGPFWVRGSGAPIDRQRAAEAPSTASRNAIQNEIRTPRNALPDEHEPAHGLLLAQRHLELRGPEGRRLHEVPAAADDVDLLEERPVDEGR